MLNRREGPGALNKDPQRGGSGLLCAKPLHRAGLLEVSMGNLTELHLNFSTPTEFRLQNIPANVSVIIFQVHSQYVNVTLSFTKIPERNDSEVSSDAGLVSVLRPQQTVCTWYVETASPDPVLASALSIPYTERDPIPGACNQEFNLEIDPNIYLQYNLYETVIKIAPANLGYARNATAGGCDTQTGQNTRWRLQYDIYQYFLPENNLSEATIITHLLRMSTVSQVSTNGKKLATLTSSDRPTMAFSSIPGQGIIYNVIVRDPFLNTSAAYVPVHTYACNFTATMDNCYTLGDFNTFRNDTVFWLTFTCIALLAPLCLLPFPRILNILSCSIVGSYGVVLAVDSYLYTSLSYITLNILKRALNSDFSTVYTSVPFQTNGKNS
ncbi:hypothetical protein AB205_0105710 [Aquarana catesbeiana]|uniref:TM7S3/TM198-like domain-containing protein n=1 Tax=Aquarana catesbeiana TaxID=8400 RepID=A0A2G9S8Q0_AQUCT|nr:hypothetical protein AB205_0105710 [Aquarana catesbeiana]